MGCGYSLECSALRGSLLPFRLRWFVRFPRERGLASGGNSASPVYAVSCVGGPCTGVGRLYRGTPVSLLSPFSISWYACQLWEGGEVSDRVFLSPAHYLRQLDDRRDVFWWSSVYRMVWVLPQTGRPTGAPPFYLWALPIYPALPTQESGAFLLGVGRLLYRLQRPLSYERPFSFTCAPT